MCNKSILHVVYCDIWKVIRRRGDGGGGGVVEGHWKVGLPPRMHKDQIKFK